MRMFGRLTGTPWWVWTAFLAGSLVLLMLGVGWFPLFVVVLAWSVAAILRSETEEADTPDATGIAGRPPEDTESMVARASNERLCELWTQSGEELRRAYLPATIMSHAALRQALLDEMQRRNPDGIDRWLADGPDQRDPGAYLSSR